VLDGGKESSLASMRQPAFTKAGVEYADALDNGESSENDGAIGDRERVPRCGVRRGSSSIPLDSTTDGAVDG
jgi:hypothetical protein